LSVLSTIDLVGFLLAFGFFLALLRFHVGTIPVIDVSAASGAAWCMLR
jgi:hypothetical protein